MKLGGAEDRMLFTNFKFVTSWHLGCTLWLDGYCRTSTRGFDVAKEDRGFASMDRVRQKEIASKGGKAAHQKGTAHEWTSEEARDAGRKGGLASHRRRREQREGESRDMVETGSFTTRTIE
jgi:general stress protein YciG